GEIDADLVVRGDDGIRGAAIEHGATPMVAIGHCHRAEAACRSSYEGTNSQQSDTLHYTRTPIAPRTARHHRGRMPLRWCLMRNTNRRTALGSDGRGVREPKERRPGEPGHSERIEGLQEQECIERAGRPSNAAWQLAISALGQKQITRQPAPSSLRPQPPRTEGGQGIRVERPAGARGE